MVACLFTIFKVYLRADIWFLLRNKSWVNGLNPDVVDTHTHAKFTVVHDWKSGYPSCLFALTAVILGISCDRILLENVSRHQLVPVLCPFSPGNQLVCEWQMIEDSTICQIPVLYFCFVFSQPATMPDPVSRCQQAHRLGVPVAPLQAFLLSICSLFLSSPSSAVSSRSEVNGSEPGACWDSCHRIYTLTTLTADVAFKCWPSYKC